MRAFSGSSGILKPSSSLPSSSPSSSSAQGLLRGGVLLVWYLWTLPFRVCCSVGLLLFVRIVARPLDFAQDQLLGRRWIRVERLTDTVVTKIRPLWNVVFPFKSTSLDAQFVEDPDFAQLRTVRVSFEDDQKEDLRPQVTQRNMVVEKTPEDESISSVESPPSPPLLRTNTKRRGKRKGKRRSTNIDDEEGSINSDPSVRLPRAAARASAAEIDKAVMLTIEAKQTHNVVEKLFWVAVMLMTLIGFILWRIDFTRAWNTHHSKAKSGSLEPSIGFEGVYGVLVVLTIAFRSDFPFNLVVLMLVVFFSGVVFGTIIARNTFIAAHTGQL